MQTFINFYKNNAFSGTPSFNKAMTVLYALASVCHHRSAQPWQLITVEEKVCTKVAFYTLNGLIVELTHWQKELVDICRMTAKKLVSDGTFENEHIVFETLQLPLTDGEFDTERTPIIFETMIDVVKEKISEVGALAD